MMEQNGKVSNGVPPSDLNSEKDLKNGSVPVVVSLDDNGAKCDSCDENKMAENGEKLSNGNGELSKDILEVPKKEHRKSLMEVECARERQRLSLLKQCSAILRKEEKYTKETLHKTFQDEDFLDRIFDLLDIERKEYLVQDDWIQHLKGRLTGPKALDFIEQVESVAYVLVGSGDVRLDTFKLVMKNKVVTNKLIRVVDTDGDGCASADEVMEFLSAVSSSRPRAGFDQYSVDRLEQLFKDTVGDQKEITKEQFRTILVTKNPFFTERVFQIFDEDDSGAISLEEFIAAVHRAGKTPDDKLRFLFKIYDLDGDGLIQHKELRDVMQACMEENNMHFSDEQLLELTEAMIEDADTENRGAITYEGLKNQLSRHEGLLENLSISIDRWLVPPKAAPNPTFIQRLRKIKPYQLSSAYLKNNYVYVSYLAVFFIINIGLFISRALEYSNLGENIFVILARACGQCLNFNCAWILVLMLRLSITQLRVSGFSAILPLDYHTYLHVVTGVLVAVYSLVHTVMHLCNFSIVVVNDPVKNAANFTLADWLVTSKPGKFGLVDGCANPTGVALCVLLSVICTCSQPAVRRRGSFEVFYWTHLLYVPFWILLLFHCPNFWKWFLVPGTIYVIERIIRFAKSKEHGKTYISSGSLLASKVTHLVVKRPAHFDFRAGDYVFVRIPNIARYEWHPFTISSAPQQTDSFTLHIRSVGQWTNRLYEYFEEEHMRLHGIEAPPGNDFRKIGRQSSRKSIKSNRKSPTANNKKRSVDFSPESFTQTVSSNPNLSLKISKKPLDKKSTSMPDVMTSQKKKKQRLIELHDLVRSESDKSFDVNSMNRAIARSPQVVALAHSFRYMRNKPVIVALNTPSTEEIERKRSNESIITLARRRLSKSLSPDKDVEAMDRPTINVVSPSESTSGSFVELRVGKPLEIHLDGPYGAASSHIFGAQHAVLVAAGIGVTPFASILQDLMFRHTATRTQCPNCQHTFQATPPNHGTRLKKVDFIWINREQKHFEWFVSLLSQLEIEQAEMGGERFLEMHMYITGALQKTDMKAVGLQLALDLLHEKEKRDYITGLKTRTNAGRPNWKKVFKQLQEQNKGKITMFYCGPPQLAQILRYKCVEFGFIFRKEVF